MRNDARKAAQSAAAHQVGLSADIGKNNTTTLQSDHI